MKQGTLRIAAYDLPVSALLDAASRRILREWVERKQQIAKECPGYWADPATIHAVREFYDRHYYALSNRYQEIYAVRIEPKTIAGVHTEIFTPAEGIAPSKTDRVLINLHGGGLTVAARSAGQLESIPVAAIGKLKVCSVDYRMAPEHTFPAATDDVVAVYRELLKDYAPEKIGIFGCSAGALLTAQTVARLLNEGLPLPAAVGMLGAAGACWSDGDSTYFGEARTGQPRSPFNEHPYFKGVDLDDPLVLPARSPDVLANFPPSLLIASTRDQVLSSVVYMHSRLVALGVDANLHVWEGLDHAFQYNPDLPYSHEVHDVTVRFFGRHLAKTPR